MIAKLWVDVDKGEHRLQNSVYLLPELSSIQKSRLESEIERMSAVAL